MKLEWWRVLVVFGGLLSLTASLASFDAMAADDPIPLDPKVAKELALLGEGVVGKPLAPPALDAIERYLNFGPGEWHYQVTHDPKAGRKVRVESYASVKGPGGGQAGSERSATSSSRTSRGTRTEAS